MFRMPEWRNYLNHPPRFKTLCDVGDEAYLLYFGQLGNVYYIDKVMSAYRRGVATSWSQRNAGMTDVNKLMKHPAAMIETYHAFDEYTDMRYHKLFAPKIAIMKFRISIYGKRSRELLSKKEKEYFSALSLSKRLTIIVAAMFPEIVLKFYLKRIKRLNKRKGYV